MARYWALYSILHSSETFKTSGDELSGDENVLAFHILHRLWFDTGSSNMTVIEVWSWFSVHRKCHYCSGVGVTKPIAFVPLFSNFSSSPKYTLANEYHVHIWQVSPQLSCGDTCQIWMWCKESNRYGIENFAYGELNERSFGNPHPRTGWRSGVDHQ